MEELDEKKLNQLSIYELRNLARSLGVPRPTTMVRNDLVDGIIKQAHAGGTFDENAKRRGRPAKSANFNIMDILDAKPMHGIAKILTQMQNDDDVDMVCDTTHELKDVEGMAYIVQRGHGILIDATMNTLVIPIKFVTSHKIKTGDYVCGKAKCTEVTSITTTKHTNFDEAQHTRPHKPQKIGGMDFKLGQRVIIAPKNKMDFVEYIASCKLDAYNIALLIDQGSDSVDYLATRGINEVYLCKVEFSRKKRLLLALSALLYAKRKASEGKDVILFVDNLNKLFRVYNQSSITVDNGSVTDLKTFFIQAGQAKTNGSLTIITCMRECQIDSEKYVMDEFIDMSHVLFNAHSDS